MIQAQISGKFAKPEQALECKVCDEPITNPANKTYLSAGIKRGRAVHKYCKAKVKQ